MYIESTTTLHLLFVLHLKLYYELVLNKLENYTKKTDGIY